MKVCRATPPRSPVDRPAQRHPVLEAEAALDDPTEQLLELVGLGLREEADLAEVDAHDRHLRLGDGAGGPQERAVAAEHDEDVDPREGAEQRRRVARRRIAQLSIPRTAHQPVARAESSTASSLVGL